MPSFHRRPLGHHLVFCCVSRGQYGLSSKKPRNLITSHNRSKNLHTRVLTRFYIAELSSFHPRFAAVFDHNHVATAPSIYNDGPLPSAEHTPSDEVASERIDPSNQHKIKNLAIRVQDWKGHDIFTFGALLLEDFALCTKSRVDRQYYIFLFEKKLLWCKGIGSTLGMQITE
jgi:hypothetical protein